MHLHRYINNFLRNYYNETFTLKSFNQKSKGYNSDIICILALINFSKKLKQEKFPESSLINSLLTFKTVS
jgi:hypothetical protein